MSSPVIQMVISKASFFPRYFHQAGMTLIEVLIALAIISIAMTAIIKAASQNIRGTQYLQEKTVAMWVAQEVMNNIRVGVIQLSGSTTQEKNTRNALGKDWYYDASLVETPNKNIKKIIVKIFTHQTDSESATPIVTLASFVYAN